MNSAPRITSRQKVECAVWFAVGLFLATAPTWQSLALDAITGPMFGSTKSAGPQRYASTLEIGLILFEVFGASASFGFAIGALDRSKRGWGIIGLIAGPILFVVYRLGTM